MRKSERERDRRGARNKLTSSEGYVRKRLGHGERCYLIIEFISLYILFVVRQGFYVTSGASQTCL